MSIQERIDLDNGRYADAVYPVDAAGSQLYINSPAAIDAGGRQRTSNLTTLFDGKTLNTDDTQIWGNAGTGTGSLVNNKYNMAVTAGQYLIRYSKNYFPYFSGKSQMVELTVDNFQPEAGLVKRKGYFSSNAVAPYNTTKDGFWLESDATSVRFIASNAGTETINTPLTSWDGYEDVATYDWSKFTVVVFDFLWLGGTSVRTTMHINGVFKLVNTFEFAGNFTGTFIKSPNQTVRYEIRSTTGAGYINAICSQVATEGSSSEAGKGIGIMNTAGITANAIGTIYALKGLKKNATFRDNVIEIQDFSCMPAATSDAGILMLILNPTISAPLSYANTSRFQEGTATTQTITANTGRVIYAITIGQSGAKSDMARNFLNTLSIAIDNTPDEFVIAYMPITTNQTVRCTVNLKEY